jgi:hypothetical protein
MVLTEGAGRKNVAGLVIKGILSGCGTVLFLLVVVSLVGLILFFIRYEQWERQEKEVIQRSAVDPVPGRESAKNELDRRVEEFNTSTVQREVLTLDCDMVNILFEDVASEHWGITDPKDVGVACGDRQFDVYIRVANMWWGVVRIWQRSEGSVDFAVYDMKVGPFSLAGLSWGKATGSMSQGIEDAITVMTTSSYTGRIIEEVYLTEDGMRIIGFRKSEEQREGVDSFLPPFYNPLLAVM